MCINRYCTECVNTRVYKRLSPLHMKARNNTRSQGKSLQELDKGELGLKLVHVQRKILLLIIFFLILSTKTVFHQ